MRTAIVAGLLVSFVAVGVAAGSPRVADPPRIVLWHQIGSAGLRMSRAPVERVYGKPYYDGPENPQYHVRGGVLFIGYAGKCNSNGGQCAGPVGYVSTDSPRYRTQAGLGVGTKIPFPPCTRDAKGRCVRRWHGFRLGHDPGTGVPVWWRWATYEGKPVTAELDVTGTGRPPYGIAGVGVVFQIGFEDGRTPAAAFAPTSP